MLIPVQFITPAGDPSGQPINAGTDPANIPDGANQFTYSTATTGILTIKLKAKVPNISAMGSTIQGNFSFSVDTVGNSTKTWDAANPNGKATVVGDYIEATVTFTGLPQHNSDFGLKKAEVLYNGSEATEQKYEVFFPKAAINHPGAGTGTNPNWFYYWQDGGVCGIGSDFQYDATKTNTFGYTLPGVDNIVRLCSLGADANTGPETYTGVAPYGSLTVTGTGKGIQCVAETIQHERHHLEIYNQFHLLVGQTNSNEIDGDAIPDASEPTYDGIASDPRNPDTYQMGGGYSTYGDNEIRCRKKELDHSITYYPKLDWANPGCQSQNSFGPKP